MKNIPKLGTPEFTQMLKDLNSLRIHLEVSNMILNTIMNGLKEDNAENTKSVMEKKDE